MLAVKGLTGKVYFLCKYNIYLINIVLNICSTTASGLTLQPLGDLSLLLVVSCFHLAFIL